MKSTLPMSIVSSVLLWALYAVGSIAAPVSNLEVRIVTGTQDLSAGSLLELRIYETGKAVRHLPLAHGETWPRESTRIIPVTLNEPVDPRNVQRFALYYRAGSPLSPPWEIVSAEVEYPVGKNSADRLLNATLTGVISKQGELATVDRDPASMTCFTDSDCDDGKSCNGRERCAPHTAGADARGCVKGTPVSCPVNQVCGEGVGCRGLAPIKPASTDPHAAKDQAVSTNSGESR